MVQPARLENILGQWGELWKEHEIRLGTIVFLHRESLAGKDWNNRCFWKLCEYLGSKHAQGPYHAEVRWLLTGKVLSHIYELKNPTCRLLSDAVWFAQVVYLADVTEQLNILNVSLQRRGYNILNRLKKLKLSKRRLPCGQVNSGFQREMWHVSQHWAWDATTGQCQMLWLQDRFNNYFPKKRRDDEWICNPIGVDMESITLQSNKETQLWLSFHVTACWKGNSVSLSQF